MARPNLCVVTAVPMSLEAFWPPLLRRAQQEFDITVIASGADDALVTRMQVCARALHVDIPRRPAPLADLRALRTLTAIFRSERFDLVHSQTPKAGLLAMTAARRAAVPARVHTFTGQVWATRKGPWRAILKSLDRRTAHAATALLADSASQAAFLSQERVVEAGKVSVLGKGSMSGVDAQRFRPDSAARHSVREELGATEGDTVLLLVGRLDRAKGVAELLRAFAQLATTRPTLRLWLVGPDEGAAALRARVSPEISARIAWCGATRTPERFMAAADLFVLPSHREGFGSTVIEAASCGIPAVASRIYGLVDAIVDGETGVLHRAQDVEDLTQQLARLVDDPALRTRMGAAARQRTLVDFDSAVIAGALMRFYEQQLGLRS